MRIACGVVWGPSGPLQQTFSRLIAFLGCWIYATTLINVNQQNSGREVEFNGFGYHASVSDSAAEEVPRWNS